MGTRTRKGDAAGSGRSRGRPAAPTPDAAAAPRLLEKYRRLVEKHEALVRRRDVRSVERTSVMALALQALRATEDGLALHDGETFLVRNARWHEVARPGPRWREVDRHGSPVGQHASLTDAAEPAIRSLIAGAGERKRILRLARADPELAVDLRLERVETAGATLVIARAEDVSARVRAEREAERARAALVEHERMRLVGELASGVAHDLNNTLHALSLRLGALRAAGLRDEASRANLELLDRIVGDAAERVARLQEFARRREDVPDETFDLARIVRDAVEIARPEIEQRAHLARVRFDVVAEVPSARAVGSASELRHVFVNLLVNARDAMPGGGRIAVRGRLLEGTAEVRVEDEGTGIAPAHLERVFDPYFTTKGRKGTGLGLAIASGVMRRLGGDIAAANRPEGGTVFTLTFPLAHEGARAEQPEPPRLSPGHRLLVVDDDEANLEAARFVLEDLGQRVDVAASGEEALRLLDRAPAYDLVLCDVGMPGMDGWQLAERIKASRPSTRVLMLTGWAAEIPRDDPKLRGVDGLLGKPLRFDALKDVLAARLQAP